MNTDPQHEALDSASGKAKDISVLLDRYVAVWLWSILFGTSAGLLFTLSDLRHGDWGNLGLLLVLPAVGALASAFISWWSLLGALRHHLLPQFFPTDQGGVGSPGQSPVQNLKPASADASTASVAAAAPRVPTYSEYLQRSFSFLIAASVFRVLMGLLELLLSAASRF